MPGKNQGLVITVFGLAAVAMSLLQPVLPLYLAAIGISPEVIGLMFAAAMVAMVIGEGYWGWVADKIGAWIPLAFGTLVCGLTVLLFDFSEEVFFLFAVFFLWGLFRSAIFGPSRGHLAAAAPAGRKTSHLAIVTAIVAASSSLGALPSGFIVDAWGFSPAFYISAGISFTGSIFVLWGYKTSRALNYRPRSRGRLKMNSNTGLLSLQCLVTALQFFGLGIMIAFLPLLVTGRTNVTIAEVGILISVRGITAMIFSVPMGRLADRIGTKTMILFGLAVTAVAMFAFTVADSFNSFVIVMVLYNIGYTAFSPAALSFFSSCSPPDRQGTAMGFYGAICENTGIVAGSGLGGFIWSAWGGQGAFLAGAVASVMGALLFMTIPRFYPENKVKAGID